jgi:hypothetical protein
MIVEFFEFFRCVLREGFFISTSVPAAGWYDKELPVD